MNINRMRAKAQKKAGTFENRAQPTFWDDEGNYTTLHPTKGWQRVSAKRIRAQQIMLQRFGFMR